MILFYLGAWFQFVTSLLHILQGGVVQIVLTWDCNLDHGIDNCLPEYTFRRLDSDTALSKGYNFR